MKKKTKLELQIIFLNQFQLRITGLLHNFYVVSYSTYKSNLFTCIVKFQVAYLNLSRKHYSHKPPTRIKRKNSNTTSIQSNSWHFKYCSPTQLTV